MYGNCFLSDKNSYSWDEKGAADGDWHMWSMARSVFCFQFMSYAVCFSFVCVFQCTISYFYSFVSQFYSSTQTLPTLLFSPVSSRCLHFLISLFLFILSVFICSTDEHYWPSWPHLVPLLTDFVRFVLFHPHVSVLWNKSFDTLFEHNKGAHFCFRYVAPDVQKIFHLPYSWICNSVEKHNHKLLNQCSEVHLLFFFIISKLINSKFASFCV